MPHHSHSFAAMARLFSSLFLLGLLVCSASASYFYKRDTSQRVCGTAFLAKSSAVLKSVDVNTICNRSYRPEVEWYGLDPETDSAMKEFCCKIGCEDEHYIAWKCMSRSK
ncbi:hypothetical protein PRIPAC_82540 [Pristionchus pacificus]|uniref:Uncharacterized protein n=1 Tax=Pristionchus pacificus TaxID=54126 RepID=A0A2A6CQR7_PRIPA|nr:hypothetical protein PRIPAC_82540 [Pristionchus pacificus]|eukprot:PDM80428.1 hypothetical protein PRIPAC_33007 [Pristionchus pacificus]